MERRPRSTRELMKETRRQWQILSIYERFEQIVAFILSLIVALIIAIALVQLVIHVVPLVLTGSVDLLEHEVFQALFGLIMTLLIALEFKHSIIRVALRRESIVQVKTVVLIALIALSRKFVIPDARTTDAATIAALADATLVLGTSIGCYGSVMTVSWAILTNEQACVPGTSSTTSNIHFFKQKSHLLRYPPRP